MNDPIQKAREYRRTNPQADLEQAAAHARNLEDNDTFVTTFLQEWRRIKTDHRSSSEDIERNWPENKIG